MRSCPVPRTINYERSAWGKYPTGDRKNGGESRTKGLSWRFADLSTCRAPVSAPALYERLFALIASWHVLETDVHPWPRRGVTKQGVAGDSPHLKVITGGQVSLMWIEYTWIIYWSVFGSISLRFGGKSLRFFGNNSKSNGSIEKIIESFIVEGEIIFDLILKRTI